MLPPSAGALDSWVKVDMGKGYDATAQGGLYGVAIGDGDRDGEIEVYASCYDNGHIYEYRRNGQAWSVKDLGVLWPGRNPRADGVLVGDGDDDGLTEVYATGYLYTTSTYVNSVYQLVNGTGGWTKTDLGSSGGWGMDLAMGDGNRDGRTELYSGDSDGHIYQYSKINAWNVQDIGSSPPFYYNNNYFNPYMRGVEVGDADNDGRNELYGASSDGHVYRYNFTGAEWERSDLGWTENGSFPLYGLLGLAIGDGDNDGQNEIYAPSYFNATLWRFKRDAKSGLWNVSRLMSLVSGGTANDICIGDGNSDGRNELYVGTSNKQLYQVWREGGAWKSSSVGSGGGAINGVAVGSTTKDTAVRQLFATSGDGRCYEYLQDRVAPSNPALWSDSHPETGKWYNDRRVHMLWGDPGCDISGIDGYATAWDGLADTVPYSIVTYEESTHDIYTTLEDGRWYFHLRTGDNLQNWNPGASHYGPVMIDTTSPDSARLAIDGGADLTNSRFVTLSVNASDPQPGSGIALMAFSNDGGNWSEWEPFCSTRAGWDLAEPLFGGNGADGMKTVFARVRDGVGRELPADRRPRAEIFLDRTAPGNLSLTINGGAASTNSTGVVLAVDARDPEPGSGLSRMAFSNDGTSWSEWRDWQNLTDWSLAGGASCGDGQKTVLFRAQDRAGNIGGPVEASILLDTGRPCGLRLEINGGARYTNDSWVSLDIAASDPEPGSPPLEMALSNSANGTGQWEPFAPGKARWSLGSGAADADGERSVWLRVRDAALNEGGPVCGTIFLDRLAPGAPNVSINGGAGQTGSRAVEISLEARDTAPSSGLELVQFSEDGRSWGDWKPFSSVMKLTLSGPDGQTTVWARVRDRAGNVGDAASASILLDTSPPVASNITVTAVTNDSATVSWTTDEPSAGRLDFGSAPGQDRTAHSAGLARNHSVRLTGLSNATTYRFRIWSSDGLSNNASSETRNFTTLENYVPPGPGPKPARPPKEDFAWAWLAVPMAAAACAAAGLFAVVRSRRRRAGEPETGKGPEEPAVGPPVAAAPAPPVPAGSGIAPAVAVDRGRPGPAGAAGLGWDEDIETLPMEDGIPVAAATAIAPPAPAPRAPPAPPARTPPTAAESPPPRTVRCTGCGSSVPLYTDIFPTRISCPGCGRSGIYRGPRPG
jgi:hypothetical protein